MGTSLGFGEILSVGLVLALGCIGSILFLSLFFVLFVRVAGWYYRFARFSRNSQPALKSVSNSKSKTGFMTAVNSGLMELLANNQFEEAALLYSQWYGVNLRVAAANLRFMQRYPGLQEPPSGFIDPLWRRLVDWLAEQFPTEPVVAKSPVAPGLAKLIERDQLDEATDLYRRFAGVDQYTAQDAVEKLRKEMGQ